MIKLFNDRVEIYNNCSGMKRPYFSYYNNLNYSIFDIGWIQIIFYKKSFYDSYK